MWLGLSLVLLLLTVPVSEARRGRGRGRTKSRVQIGLPITGKYRDPESDQYYNNNNVSLKHVPSEQYVIKCIYIIYTLQLVGGQDPAGLALRSRVRAGPQDCISVRG